MSGLSSILLKWLGLGALTILPLWTVRGQAFPHTAAALARRMLGSRGAEFRFERIPPDHGRDVYEIESRDGRIILRGNNAVSMASALNAYLRDYCNVHFSWNCGDQKCLPATWPPVARKVRTVSPYLYRFVYNYCTHGYTLAWRRWPEWERELDFLAMQGVNLALVIEGEEQVWIDTLTAFGYSPAEVRAWLCMPTHQPWQYMANMQNYGGPVPASLVAARLELGRRIVQRMRELGIEPVLQGFYGIVPADFHRRFPEATVHPQGRWSIFKRPDMLDPRDPLFRKIAHAFYASQKRLFGPVLFYEADPFHEGGRTRGIDLAACGRAIYAAMNAASPGATWVLMSWQANPRQAMLDALPKEHLLVLDLFCEVHENWRSRHQFGGTPWLWCTIHNFGGNNGMAANLRAVADGPSRAWREAGAGRGFMKGIGALMEGSETNPMIWEMFFRNCWTARPPDLDAWLRAYARRRYGAENRSALRALRIIVRTAYSIHGGHGQFPHNSAVCARPSLNPNQRANPYTGTTPEYDPVKLAAALPLLLAAAPDCAGSDAWRYDVADLGRQVLADLGTKYHREICDAWRRRDAAALAAYSRKMLALIRGMDDLVRTRKEFLLGVWLRDARSWGTTPAEKNLCEWNARTLLTTWSVPQSHLDYANRDWAGLLRGFYLHRWRMWTDALRTGVAAGWKLDVRAVRQRIRAWEYAWTHQTEPYSAQPSGDTLAVARRLWKEFGADALDPVIGLGRVLTDVSAKDFFGRWRYRALGAVYVREIRPDGTLLLFRNNSRRSSWQGFRWTFEKPFLILHKADGSVFGRHVLRDKNTMLFLGEPWPPAIRTAFSGREKREVPR